MIAHNFTSIYNSIVYQKHCPDQDDSWWAMLSPDGSVWIYR